MTMTTIRVKKDARYFSASNEPFNDKRLSWEARGLMGYLLSKPNDWEVRMKDLEKQGPAGNRKLRRMLAELRLYKYMNRIRLKLDNGKFDWITEVYESPSQNPNKSTSGSFCTSAISTSAKQPNIVKTKRQSTNPSKKKEGASAAPKANDFPSNVLFREVTERYPAKANWYDVLKFIDEVARRLGRQPTKEDLFPFYSAWCGNGWRTDSIHWLEYAVSGQLPQKGMKPNANTSIPPQPKPQYTPEQLAAAEWINQQRANRMSV